jgi:hypothetical protein
MNYIILKNEIGEYSVAEVTYVPLGETFNKRIETIIKVGFKNIKEAKDCIDRLERATTGHRVE